MPDGGGELDDVLLRRSAGAIGDDEQRSDRPQHDTTHVLER
jgi:hypothetical protein